MDNPRIIPTNDGSHSLESEHHGLAYHSRFGAITESKHVFLEHGLIPLSKVRTSIHLLEIGLGTGLNALLSFLFAKGKTIRLAYTALEPYPVPLETVRSLNYPEQLDLGPEDRIGFERLHTGPWEVFYPIEEGFSFSKSRVRLQEFQPVSGFDLVYFDAFAPEAQPELWRPEVFRTIFNWLNPGGLIVTYCAKGAVKRALKSAGFMLEALPGPPGKREMTRAGKPSN